MILKSAFDIRDVVTIDGDPTVRAIVVAIRWSRDEFPHYEVSYMDRGKLEFVYIDEWRLSK